MGFVKKEMTTIRKIEYLEDNLAVLKSQRYIDVIESFGKTYKRNKTLSEDQELYLDIIVKNVKQTRGH